MSKILILLAALVILSLRPVWRTTQQLTQPAINYSLELVDRLASGMATFLNAGQWQRENEQLRNQVALLHGKLGSYAELVNENEQLRQLNAMVVPLGYKKIGSRVVGQQIDESGSYYLLDRGGRDGLQVGMPVVVGLEQSQDVVSATILGTIQTVSERMSSFNLTTSSASQIIIQINNESYTQTLAAGEYNLAIRLKFIPQDNKIEAGQLVFTSNLNPLIPPGLLVGVISEVSQIEGDFFKSAIVTPPLEITNLNYVYVLAK